MQNNKILVVDDSECIRTLLAHILDSLGYLVSTAEDGDEALAQLSVFHPDLVLMDVEMPVLGGCEACRRIRGNPATRDIPVLMVSANQNAAERALAAGADEFIAKPFSLDEVLSKIHSRTGADLAVTYA